MDQKMLERIVSCGIVPVVALGDARHAVPLAKALAKGGIDVVEVTFRTDAAEESIRAIAAELPEVLVGAGTVLTKEQVDRAIGAGAQFLVSPGFNPEIVAYALSKGAPIVPGTATPGEMEQAIALGLDAVKFFPAEQNGGVAALKAVSAVYRNLRFMPTGGVNPQNLNDYLSFDKVLACGGSWMVKNDLVEAERYDEISTLAAQAVSAMLGFSVAHIGMNQGSEAEALALAELFALAFGFDIANGNSSVFCGERKIEINKKPGRGEHGHIAIATNSIVRAVAHLKRRGFNFAEESAVIKNGKLIAIYLEREFGGFAVHLLQK